MQEIIFHYSVQCSVFVLCKYPNRPKSRKQEFNSCENKTASKNTVLPALTPHTSAGSNIWPCGTPPPRIRRKEKNGGWDMKGNERLDGKVSGEADELYQGKGDEDYNRYERKLKLSFFNNRHIFNKYALEIPIMISWCKVLVWQIEKILIMTF